MQSGNVVIYFNSNLICLRLNDSVIFFKTRTSLIFFIANRIYTRQNTLVFSCFLDASKAFHRVNHWKLFSKLIIRKVPLMIVRMFIF